MTSRPTRAFAVSVLIALAGCSQMADPPAPAANPPAPPAPKENLEPSTLDRTGLPPLSDAGTLALKVLLGASRFTSDAVGEGGERPVEVEAFRLLHREKGAKAAFRHLLENGTTEGRLFGLCGLWYAEPDAFEETCKAFLEEHGEESVKTHFGCEVAEIGIAELVRNPDPSGVVRLKDRAQTVKQWYDATKAENAVYDIAGGAWPCVLRSGGGW